MPLNFLPMIFQLCTVAFGLVLFDRYEIRQEWEGIFFGALYPIGLGLWVVGRVEAMECGRLDTMGSACMYSCGDFAAGKSKAVNIHHSIVAIIHDTLVGNCDVSNIIN